MKKIISFFVFAALIVIILFMIYSSARQVVHKLASPLPTTPVIPTEIVPTKTPAKEFKLDGKTYQFYFHKIEKKETLSLIPNFQNAIFSLQIMKNNNCTFGINGGFYKKEGGSLGLFYTDQKLYGTKIQSTTFNGILGGKKDGTLFIMSSMDFPVYSDYSASVYQFLLQSGPLIFLKNALQPNYIEEDYSRRSLIAKTVGGDFYLFSIFEKDNAFNGPRLKDLRGIFLTPEFIGKIPDFSGTSFELILNLDGGSASAFYDKNVQVEEFNPIGSFLCGK